MITRARSPSPARTGEHVRARIVAHGVGGLFHQRRDLRADVRGGAIERVLEAGQAFEREADALSHGAPSAASCALLMFFEEGHLLLPVRPSVLARTPGPAPVPVPHARDFLLIGTPRLQLAGHRLRRKRRRMPGRKERELVPPARALPAPAKTASSSVGLRSHTSPGRSRRIPSSAPRVEIPPPVARARACPLAAAGGDAGAVAVALSRLHRRTSTPARRPLIACEHRHDARRCRSARFAVLDRQRAVADRRAPSRIRADHPEPDFPLLQLLEEHRSQSRFERLLELHRARRCPSRNGTPCPIRARRRPLPPRCLIRHPVPPGRPAPRVTPAIPRP